MFDRRVYNAQYYRAHRDSEIERVTRRQQETLAWLRDLRRVPCTDCGATCPPHVMDFDHRDPREKSFSLVSGKCLLKNRDVLAREIAKCDIVCANCHRERTERQRPYYAWGWPTGGSSPRLQEKRARRLAQIELILQLKDAPCADRGARFPPYVMEFDHRPDEIKRCLVSQMAGRASTALILAEAGKCDIVCCNCHRDRSFQRRAASAGVAQSGQSACPPSRMSRVRIPSPAPLQLRLLKERPALYAA